MVTPLDVRVAGAIAAAANTSSKQRGGPQGGYTFEQEVFRALVGTYVWEHCAGPDHFDMALDLVGKSGTRYEFDGAFLSGDTLYVIEAKKVSVLARQHVGIFVQKLFDILLAPRESIASVSIKPILASSGPKINSAAWLHAVSWGILLVSPQRPTPVEILTELDSSPSTPTLTEFRAECEQLTEHLWRPIDRLIYPSEPGNLVYHVATNRILGKDESQQLVELWRQCVARAPRTVSPLP